MIFWLILCLLISIGCCYFCYRFLSRRKDGAHWQAFFYKSSAGLCFVAVGLILAVCRNRFWAIPIGLFCGLLGDQLLALRMIYPRRHNLFFCSGAAVFCIGHIFYILALWKQFSGSVWNIFPIQIILVILSLLYSSLKKVPSHSLRIISVVYISVVALMHALSLCTFAALPGTGTGLMMLGTFSFFISNNLLLVYTFGEKNQEMNIWLHFTYYLGQLFIAWSILFL